MNNRLLVLLLAVVLAIGALCGVAIKGWTTKPCPTYTEKPQTTQAAVSDSERAVLYAEGFDAGRASVRPVIRTVEGKTEVVYDPAAVEEAYRAYAIIDSIMSAYSATMELVAHDVIDLPDHQLELYYRMRDQTFRDSRVTCTKPQAIQTIEIPRPETWWDRWSLGITGGVGPVYIPGEGVRLGAGVLVGLQYAF